MSRYNNITDDHADRFKAAVEDARLGSLPARSLAQGYMRRADALAKRDYLRVLFGSEQHAGVAIGSANASKAIRALKEYLDGETAANSVAILRGVQRTTSNAAETVRETVRQETVDSERDAEQDRATVTAKPAPTGSTLEQAIRDIVGPVQIDEKAIRKIVADAIQGKAVEATPESVKVAVAEILGDVPPMVVHVKPTDTKIDCKGQHEKYPRLIAKAALAQRTWIAGPAGSGKTTGAEHAAKALGYRLFIQTPCMMGYDVLGYRAPDGHLVTPQFAAGCLHEGDAMILLDEVDGWGPSAQLAANTALANGVVVLPELGPVDITFGGKYRKWFVATANTWGHGATAEYVGRSKLDGAFLNRWSAKIFWGYDEGFERNLATAKAKALADAMGKDYDPVPIDRLISRVQKAREYAASKGIKIIISPRQTFDGAESLVAGDSESLVWNEIILGGATEQQAQDIRKHAGVA